MYNLSFWNERWENLQKWEVLKIQHSAKRLFSQPKTWKDKVNKIILIFDVKKKKFAFTNGGNKYFMILLKK